MVSTLNVRAIGKKAKRDSIFEELFAKNDIVILTETWLNINLKWLHPDLKML